MAKYSAKSFTLVEMVVSVLIVGILAGLSIPKFIDLHNEAQQSTEDAVAGAVRSGILNYSVDSSITGRAPLYPATLDDALDGGVSGANRFFTRVLAATEVSDWQKNGLAYTGPAGNVYNYDPLKGTFESGIGLLYKWSMDEGDGGTIGEGGYLGQIHGDAQWAPGKVGSGLHFDGLGSYASIADSSILDLTTAGTLESWIYVDSVPAFAGIIHKGDKANFSDEAYSLQFWTGNTIALVVNPTGTSNYSQTAFLQSDTVIAPNQWYHVVGTWDTSGMKIYVNGVLDTSNNTAAVAQASPGALNIGAQCNENYSSGWLNLPFHGVIDEAQIFDRALSADEIQSYYDSTK